MFPGHTVRRARRSVLLFSSYLSSFPQARPGQKTDYRLYFLFIFHVVRFNAAVHVDREGPCDARCPDDIFTIHAARQKEGLPYRSGEIWIDALSCAASLLHDFRIKEKGITFGPVAEQDAVPDFYPYWFAWAEFSVEETLTRNPKSYQHLL